MALKGAKVFCFFFSKKKTLFLLLAAAAPVPATLPGATVVESAAGARAWIAAHHAAVIDVAPAPVRPAAMAPGMPWLPAAHQDIPGSAWLPGGGDAARADAYLRAVAARVGAPPGGAVLVYCHPHCWASWNAAHRLVQRGYRQVAWFPGGIEAWAAAGFDVQRTQAIPY